ncbi:putative CTP synthase (glutamine hydrolyzing) [Lupinus albus]|uniref:Putative CTP synthase (Glutamine hydrolyzing) n=1 Tax=Lupinus albus TaxID=3870 RepID=A0A6A4QD46_LUPAL|nr:putative CTP synthase (glutamine hydrolyzing) [Lupinus albus]
MVSILVLQILLCVIELGVTVGDIESMPFIEALRQLSFSVGMSIAYFSFKLTV